MSFDPSNYSLKIHDSYSQSESPLVSVWAHSLTLFHTLRSVSVSPGLHFWLAPFHALALVASPRLGSWHMHKVVKWFVEEYIYK
jgi:hypothetical protein